MDSGTRKTCISIIKAAYRDFGSSMTNVMVYLNIVLETFSFGLQTDVHHYKENNV